MIQFEAEQIATIAEEACGMFGLEILPSGTVQRPRGTILSGVIHIRGSWTGAVRMGCSPQFARRLASNLFCMEPHELTDEEVEDAFGELVNVTTGNIKALLPPGCTMGVPMVSAEPAGSVEGNLVQLWGFDVDGDHLTVIVDEAA